MDLINQLGPMKYRMGVQLNEAPYNRAELAVYEDHVRILDGWNCGEITAQIIFPSTNTALKYLAGLWSHPVTDSNTITWEMDPPVANSHAQKDPYSPTIRQVMNSICCGFQGDPVCNPPDCSGACPPTGIDSRPERPTK